MPVAVVPVSITRIPATGNNPTATLEYKTDVPSMCCKVISPETPTYNPRNLGSNVVSAGITGTPFSTDPEVLLYRIVGMLKVSVVFVETI